MTIEPILNLLKDADWIQGNCSCEGQVEVERKRLIAARWTLHSIRDIPYVRYNVLYTSLPYHTHQHFQHTRFMDG